MDFGKIAKDTLTAISGGPKTSEQTEEGSGKAFDEDTGAPPSTVVNPDNITTTLAQRGTRYGTFKANSEVYMQFMQMVYASPNCREGKLSPAHLHALGNIGTKLARLLTGDPNYDDNWRDIAGYATLMVSICNGEDR